ncbi:hypothetical protein K493DRAFT_352533 [Basidiobolus meristosporus CBS 931.73]|uniref:Twin-arginine translocation signal domain-containing protein n=1 Tax=Basidiobolus meristosporus CBS 931.73 TaxID=1314790 RepID=A0A1Y1Y8Q8_9FUNG|nr:hypothetical protein K493DRAFT_352533 [Basidiobolus meristosporus CBS 931.73]|eukprot:ORX94410.1 hypothetical protein K493DRAFT_352533 [Basidiobolus meristosporus CBS 931.73]
MLMIASAIAEPLESSLLWITNDANHITGLISVGATSRKRPWCGGRVPLEIPLVKLESLQGHESRRAFLKTAGMTGGVLGIATQRLEADFHSSWHCFLALHEGYYGRQSRGCGSGNFEAS